MKRTTITLLSITLAGVVGLSALILPNLFQEDCDVLKVANWAEYIDEGDAEEGTNSMVEDFEIWYEEQTGRKIRVEYCVADDNETLYNMLKMGDQFDLVCPSEYMIMKLVAEKESYLQPLPDSFFDKSIATNYYVNNLSPFIAQTFKDNTMKTHDGTARWEEYAAGYMWGTTGFVYTPNDLVDEGDVKDWNVFLNKDYAQQITAKNNVRDTYFTGLAIHYDDLLTQLKQDYTNGVLAKEEYQATLREKMNDATPETMDQVHGILKNLADNLYGFETDEGKAKMLAGDLAVNYQWSGDAANIIYEAEFDDEGNRRENAVDLYYSIPDTVSNLWFDAWVLTKDCRNVDAATMFINFLARPDNAIRNMNYIGYTSCSVGSYDFEDEDPTNDVDVFSDYVLGEYEDEDGSVEYDLNYYFNPEYDGTDAKRNDTYVFTTTEKESKRRLLAQYPLEDDLVRCVAMQFFEGDANERANLMWSDVTFFWPF
ncbi:MAG: ABC transporter substrate-binding protein [Clostridia bacterium]|nr:ABC transporter substrate-binding protein [Clostridia bacterium]